MYEIGYHTVEMRCGKKTKKIHLFAALTRFFFALFSFLFSDASQLESENHTFHGIIFIYPTS